MTVVPNWHVQQIHTQTLASGDVKATGVRIVRPGGINQPNETLDLPLADTGVAFLARMGDNIADSVTDGFGRIHDTTNCFCAGPGSER